MPANFNVRSNQSEREKEKERERERESEYSLMATFNRANEVTLCVSNLVLSSAFFFSQSELPSVISFEREFIAIDAGEESQIFLRASFS